MGTVINGSYIGNATDNQWIAISDASVVPKVIFLNVDSTTNDSGGILYLNDLGSLCWPIGRQGSSTTLLIKDTQAGSFQISDNSMVNENGGSFFYTVFPEDTSIIRVGSYFGTGADAREINVSGSTPDWVILGRKDYGLVITKIGNIGSDVNYLGINRPQVGSNILYMSANGFTVMNHPFTNNQFGSYYYAVFYTGSTGKVGSYFGNDTNNRAITTSELNNTFTLVKPHQTATSVGSNLLNGLLHHFPLDAHGRDIVGGSNGTVSGPTPRADGKVGSCYSFDGTDDEIAFSSAINGKTGLTIALWAKPTSSANSYLVSDNKTGVGENSFRIVSNAWFARITTTGEVGILTTTAPVLNTWQHVGLTYDGAFIRVFKNGAYIGSVAQTGNVAADQSAKLGNYDAGTGRYTGSLDEVAIWNRALTLQELGSLYALGSGRVYPFINNLGSNQNYSVWKNIDMVGNDSSTSQEKTAFIETHIKGLANGSFVVGSDLNG